jgi:hypothetical protein
MNRRGWLSMWSLLVLDSTAIHALLRIGPRANTLETSRQRSMSALGQKQRFSLRNDMSALPPKAVEIANIAGADGGQSISALPSTSNIDLLRYGESVVHIDAEIPHSALYLGVTKQKLDGAQIPGAPVNQRCLRSPQ